MVMPERKVVDAGLVYTGWARIAQALRAHVRTAQRHAKPQARPRLRVERDPLGRPYAKAEWVDVFLRAKAEPQRGVRCSRCGSTDVEMAMWVNPNTMQIGDGFGTFNEEDSSYCNDCGEHGTLEQV